jgi:hypothetical protein
MPTISESWVSLASELEQEGLTPENSRRLAARLARRFGVRDDEVGILRVEGSTLVFCHPAKLQEVGRIPLNSSSSIAARTANTRRPEMLNNFSQVKHTSFFEAVNLSEAEVGDGERPDLRGKVIQKLISVPVMEGRTVRGVIQVSRKGPSSSAAGPDFTQQDLQQLADAASALVACFHA